MVIVDFDPVNVLRYQYYLHMLGCMVVFAMALATGMSPSAVRGHGSRLVCIIAAIFLAVQMPVSLIRFGMTYADGFTLTNPMKTYVNFMWSPMATVVLIWLYTSHLASSCYHCFIGIPRKNINPSPQFINIIKAVLTGVATSFIVFNILCPVLKLPHMWVIRVLFGISLALAPLEIIYIRARHNEIRFFNYTWAWFAGTWLFFLPQD